MIAVGARVLFTNLGNIPEPHHGQTGVLIFPGEIQFADGEVIWADDDEMSAA